VAGAHDPAHGRTADRALCVGASGRGALSADVPEIASPRRTGDHGSNDRPSNLKWIYQHLRKFDAALIQRAKEHRWKREVTGRVSNLQKARTKWLIHPKGFVQTTTEILLR
jgi:hypothetical protein